MTIDADGDLGHELGRVLTELVCPEEADIYDELVEAGPTVVKSGDHPLGYGGIDEAVQALSPSLLAVAQALVAYAGIQLATILKDLSNAAAQEATAALKVRMRDWIRSKLSKPSPLAASPFDANAIKQELIAKARASGLDEATCEKLVDILTRTQPLQAMSR